MEELSVRTFYVLTGFIVGCLYGIVAQSTAFCVRRGISDLARSHRDSAVLARTTLEELRRACPKCRNRGVRQANFGVLRGSRVPSIVIEFGFLSHHVEEQRLTSRRAHARFAEALSHVVRRMDQHFTETH